MSQVDNRSQAMHRYLELKAKLIKWRECHANDTPEEDAILDEMDGLWWEMSQDERKGVDGI